jgi:hypothetical protein
MRSPNQWRIMIIGLAYLPATYRVRGLSAFTAFGHDIGDDARIGAASMAVGILGCPGDSLR